MIPPAESSSSSSVSLTDFGSPYCSFGCLKQDALPSACFDSLADPDVHQHDPILASFALGH